MNILLFSIQLQLNRTTMPINLGIEFCKPRHAKDHWVFNLGTTRNSTATRVVLSANYTKIMAVCDEITLDLSEV